MARNLGNIHRTLGDISSNWKTAASFSEDAVDEEHAEWHWSFDSSVVFLSQTLNVPWIHIARPSAFQLQQFVLGCTSASEVVLDEQMLGHQGRPSSLIRPPDPKAGCPSRGEND